VCSSHHRSQREEEEEEVEGPLRLHKREPGPWAAAVACDLSEQKKTRTKQNIEIERRKRNGTHTEMVLLCVLACLLVWLALLPCPRDEHLFASFLMSLVIHSTVLSSLVVFCCC
jgi:hypothetical protein